jgi:predicted membrane channel-forming protein YqfA (hemolysin III family)
MIWFWLSAASMVATGFAHSFFGERRIIMPILASGIPVATHPLGRFVIRFAWHLTTVLMLLCAVTALLPDVPHRLVALTATAWLVVGLFDAIASKGKHIGWPPITLSGVFALIGLYA